MTLSIRSCTKSGPAMSSWSGLARLYLNKAVGPNSWYEATRMEPSWGPCLSKHRRMYQAAAMAQPTQQYSIERSFIWPIRNQTPISNPSIATRRGIFSYINPFTQSVQDKKQQTSTHNSHNTHDTENIITSPFAVPARKHQERRLVPFSPQELYEVVADVDQYKHFVPWCMDSRVINRDPQNLTMHAKLKVGFQMYNEEYTSHILLEPGKRVKVKALDSTLFEHLTNEWYFKRGPENDTSWLDFLLAFQFKSSLYQGASNLFFDEVVSKMVQAFENRCCEKYGRTPRHTRHPGPSRRY